MKKIFIFIILGILLAGVITAVSLSVSKDSFTKEVTEISSSLFYEKMISLNKIDSKEIPKDTTLSLENSGLEITQNKDGVYRVRAK